jgi:hypothetical protein
VVVGGSESGDEMSHKKDAERCICHEITDQKEKDIISHICQPKILHLFPVIYLKVVALEVLFFIIFIGGSQCKVCRASLFKNEDMKQIKRQKGQGSKQKFYIYLKLLILKLWRYILFLLYGTELFF